MIILQKDKNIGSFIKSNIKKESFTTITWLRTPSWLRPKLINIFGLSWAAFGSNYQVRQWPNNSVILLKTPFFLFSCLKKKKGNFYFYFFLFFPHFTLAYFSNESFFASRHGGNNRFVCKSFMIFSGLFSKMTVFFF